MGISIKRVETEELARQVAVITGESLTEAIHQALVEKVARLSTPYALSAAEEAAKLAFFAELDARPILDPRDWREIEAELYDENGQPIG
ncbi:MAG: type II toxin-antitoxin system VapB family antitoxin [Gemmatimonadaceae bacterium]|nr:type II toxin-antitoxin system VapB family antitoxin [Caulobacter sp.]